MDGEGLPDNHNSRSLPIDRGWAWVVLVAGCIGNAIMWGSCFNVGVLNVLFLDAFHDTKGNTAWIGAVSACLISSVGPVSSLFVNKVGFRWTVIIGGALTSIGSALSFFAERTLHLVATFGIIGGFGLGLCYTPLICCVALYFHKYRIMATALSSIGSGVGTMLFAPMIQSLADTYDWRGAMLLLGGIQLHLCICGALLRPLPKDVLQSSPSLDSKDKSTKAAPLFQFEVCKNTKVIIFMSNIFLVNLGLFIVFLHLSAYAITQGTSVVEAALLLSMVGLSSILSRIVIPASATDSRVGVLLVYSGSLGVTGVVILLTPFLMPYLWGQMLAAFFFGFYANGYVPLMTPLLVEFVGLNLLTAACGMVNLTSGLGTLLGPPLAGWIYDGTSHYKYGFYFAGTMLVCSSVIMFLAPVLSASKPSDNDVVSFDEKEIITVGDISQSVLELDKMHKTLSEFNYIGSSINTINFIGSTRSINTAASDNRDGNSSVHVTRLSLTTDEDPPKGSVKVV